MGAIQRRWQRDDLSLLDLIAGPYCDNKWWMRLSLSHPPESRRLLVAGSVCWIISGLDLGEPLHAGGMNFGYAVFERSALNLIFDLAIPQSAFKGDELPLLESCGELREIPPGIDAMPFGAGFVVAFVVLPAFLGCDVEDDVLFVVLSGFGFCVLSEAADEGDFVDYVELGWFCQRDFVTQPLGVDPTLGCWRQSTITSGFPVTLPEQSRVENRRVETGHTPFCRIARNAITN
jgi:hypothetical protein